MILTLWLSLLGLSAFVMVLGYVTGDEPYLTVGLFFLFLLSTIIITGNLQYESGANITQSVVGNTTSTNVTYAYTSWNDNTSQKTGWALGIISGIGIALNLYNTSKNRREI